MTAQEQELIDGLVERIRNTQVTDKDVAAEQHLQQGLAGYPDAVYVLAQTVLVQQYGLQQAQSQLQQAQAQIAEQQAQIDDLRQHATQSSGGGSFLSHIFGGSSQQSPAQNPSYQPVSNPSYPYGGSGSGGPASAPQGYPPQGYPAQYPPAYAQPSGYGPGGGGGFLRGALQTAAGVAAGEMAFASMESLFHGFGGGSGSGFGGGGFGGGRPEEVINNYYGESGEHHGEHSADSLGDTGGSHNDGFGNDTSSDRFADDRSSGSDDTNNDAFADTQGDDPNESGDSNFGDSGSDDSGFDSGDAGGDDQS